MDPDIHYFAPRKELIDRAYTRLIGKNPEKDGHYIRSFSGPGRFLSFFTGASVMLLRLNLFPACTSTGRR
jgi:hypothetical protein